jgi:hypothetical protein
MSILAGILTIIAWTFLVVIVVLTVIMFCHWD